MIPSPMSSPLSIRRNQPARPSRLGHDLDLHIKRREASPLTPTSAWRKDATSSTGAKRKTSTDRSKKRKVQKEKNKEISSGISRSRLVVDDKKVTSDESQGEISNRFHLLGFDGKERSFIVAGEGPANTFKVVLSAKIYCSCGQNGDCLHSLFVLEKVLKRHQGSNATLDETEISSLLRNFEEDRSSRILGQMKRALAAEAGLESDEIQENVCSICFDRVQMGNEATVICGRSNKGCHSPFHKKCISILQQDSLERRKTLLCPACLQNWSAEPELTREVRRLQESPNRPPGSNSSGYSSMHAGLTSPTSTTTSSDIWSMFESGGEDVSLPKTSDQSISQRHWATANAWSGILGRDLVSCLFHADWKVRETALKHLAAEVSHLLDCSQEWTDKAERVWRCAADVVAKTVGDKVYKVYVASVRCLQTLLAHTKPTSKDVLTMTRVGVRPIVQNILAKCADGNKRIAELSVETILEFCKGDFGMLKLGQAIAEVPNPLGIDFVLQVILEERDHLSSTVNTSTSTSNSWQATMGRLSALDKILRAFQPAFELTAKEEHHRQCDSPQYRRVMMAIDYSFSYLSSSHSNVSKCARVLFVLATKLTVADPESFSQVWELLGTLDYMLQMRLKRKLKEVSTTYEHYLLMEKLQFVDETASSITNTSTTSTQKNQNTWRPKLNRSISHSPSRQCLSPERGSSQSPIRLRSPIAGRAKLAKNDSPYKHPQRPTHLPLKKSKRLTGSGSSSSPSHRLRQKIKGSHFHQQPPVAEYELQICEQPASSHVTKSDNRGQRIEDISGFSGYAGLTETPLPVIPGLTLPFYEDPLRFVELHKREYEVKPYEEGRSWTRGTLLGSGAYSTCFQARDITTGTLMAVKQITLKRNSEDDHEHLEQLIRDEVDLLSKLRHPHTIRTFGVTRDESNLNIFVEWMAGGSVASLLDRHGPFNDVVIARYTFQVLLGLDYLHSCGILHRDLKGANLLVDTTGQHIRISDFGSAARMQAQVSLPGEFQGQMQGTIAFMAPEVLRGEDYGRSCDIWSLGCCIIEMATTKPPWNASDVSNHLALIYKIACSHSPPVIPSGLSLALRDFCLRCLQREPERRPSAQELLYHPVYYGSGF